MCSGHFTLPASLTDLCHDQFGQRPNELRRGIPIPLDRLFINHLADGEPQGCLQSLYEVNKQNPTPVSSHLSLPLERLPLHHPPCHRAMEG